MGEATSANSGRRRIVIADDSPEMLAIVETRLLQHYDVAGKAEDGLQLIECVRNLQPDIFVTDISMPGISGIEVLRRLRLEEVTIPAVILTVHEDEELLEASLSHGALGFVLKSRIDRDLLPAIEAALEGRVFISERMRAKHI
jgi:DNA-binding NarL/FixJ family response regulator